MVDLDVRIGGFSSAKEVGVPEIRRTWDCSKAKRQGKGIRSGVQQQIIYVAGDHGEAGRDDGGGTLGEPPLPLGGRC